MRCKNCGELIANFSLEPDDAPRWTHLEGMQARRCPDGSGKDAEPEDHDSGHRQERTPWTT